MPPQPGDFPVGKNPLHKPNVGHVFEAPKKGRKKAPRIPLQLQHVCKLYKNKYRYDIELCVNHAVITSAVLDDYEKPKAVLLNINAQVVQAVNASAMTMLTVEIHRKVVSTAGRLLAALPDAGGLIYYVYVVEEIEDEVSYAPLKVGINTLEFKGQAKINVACPTRAKANGQLQLVYKRDKRTRRSTGSVILIRMADATAGHLMQAASALQTVGRMVQLSNCPAGYVIYAEKGLLPE